MRTLTIPLQPKRITRKGKKRITGYAALFYDPSNPGSEYRFGEVTERISPGAFKLTGEPDVLALFNHDPNQILGRQSAGTLALRVDSKGLRYSIDAETRLGQELLHSIERGDIQGSSFGFQVKEQDMDRSNGQMVRNIKSVELFDVGPVSEPAYQGTSAEARKLDTLNKVLEGHQTTQAALEKSYDS